MENFLQFAKVFDGKNSKNLKIFSRKISGYAPVPIMNTICE